MKTAGSAIQSLSEWTTTEPAQSWNSTPPIYLKIVCRPAALCPSAAPSSSPAGFKKDILYAIGKSTAKYTSVKTAQSVSMVDM